MVRTSKKERVSKHISTIRKQLFFGSVKRVNCQSQDCLSSKVHQRSNNPLALVPKPQDTPMVKTKFYGTLGKANEMKNSLIKSHHLAKTIHSKSVPQSDQDGPTRFFKPAIVDLEYFSGYL